MNKYILLIMVIIVCGSASVTAETRVPKTMTVIVDENLYYNNYGLKSSETESEYTISSHIYDTLLEFNDEGDLKSGLATKWDILNPTTVRLHLRRDVLFHNGDRFDSKDVKFSLEYYRGKNMFASIMLDTIARIDIIDKYCIDIILNRHDGAILRKLAMWARVYPKGVIERIGEKKFEANPVGTGPYSLDGVVKGKKVTLKRHPDYWRGPSLNIEEVVFIHGAKPNDRKKHAYEGEADVITNIEAQDALNISKIGKYNIIKQPAYYSVFGVFNTNKVDSPLTKLNVRKAINHAIDRNFLERLLLKGNGRIIASLTMPGEVGHDDGIRPYQYDLKRAKALMNKAGYAAGFKMVVGLQPGLNVNSKYCKFIKESLKRINIDVVYDDKFDLKNISSSNKESGLTIWNGDMLLGGDPSPYMHSEFYLKCFFVEGAPYRLVDDHVLNNMYTKAISQLDADSQNSSFRDIDSYIYNKAYGLFSHQLIRIHAVGKGLSYTPSRNGMISIRDIR